MRYKHNKIRTLILFCSLITTASLVACSGSTEESATEASNESSETAASATSSSVSGSETSSLDTSSEPNSSSVANDETPLPSGPPVKQGNQNAAGQTPAFNEQTRAPEIQPGESFKQTVVASGLTNPWGLQFLPDGNAIITERNGSIKLATQNGDLSDISGAPQVNSGGQGGLLDVNISPSFTTDRNVYLCFSEPVSGGKTGTALAKGKLNASNSAIENLEVIFRQNPPSSGTKHYGCRIVFDPQNHLFLTIGDRGEPSKVQATESHIGKVIRLDADGEAPNSNPFFSSSGAAEVWSYGHRNPQGAAIHPESGELWTIEHGPQGGDELNRPQAGGNYGWPDISYGINYDGSTIGSGTSRSGVEQPVYYWDPVIAPAGMTFYDGSMFPSWNGDLFIGGLKTQSIVRLRMVDNKVVGEQRFDIGARVRDVVTGPQGAIWFINDDGELAKISK